jgi:hypothetical protein
MPCEDIQIFPEKSDECEFLFGLKACADLELLVRVAGVKYNFLIISLLLFACLLIDGLLIER